MTTQGYIRESIKGWMKERGKRPEDMARLTGVSVPTWYRKMKFPGKMTVQELEMYERITKIKFFKEVTK